ncbi:MAG TPA: adenosylcobinamide-GDP ribazoletransferase [Nocardioidaceae bacterium]|nr:adenosylcobinamide-GDP ribazoletransferase [Nocardioidaceae bacterium]
MNAVRLAVGTLTIFPTRPPSLVDEHVAGRAMVLAPFVGGLVAVPLWVVSALVDEHWSSALVAVLWVAALAVLTRGMHLDGLADTADGLGSGKPPAEALEIMRKGDVGPFGVTTIVLVLLAQVMAASELLVHAGGAGLVAVAVVLSRSAIPWVCVNRPAREGGLGAMVAGSVSTAQAVLALAAAALIVAVMAVVGELDSGVLLAGVVGSLAGLALCAWCVRRLGGITGDVIGACVEAAFTGALLAMTLA